MTTFRSYEEVAESKVSQEPGRWRLEYYDDRSGSSTGLLVFLVDSQPNREVRAHFHDADQFQIMFGGGGATYKRSTIPGVFLHYADAYTTYGPFGSGEGRFSFMTIRAKRAAVTAYMPESRDQLPAATQRRRHYVADVTPLLGAERPASGSRLTTVMGEDDADGVRASLLSLAADEPVALPGGEAPTYYLILDGAIVDAASRVYGPLSVGVGDTADPGPGEFRASADGCSLLILRFAEQHALQGAGTS
jgi:hypothetical protein